MTTSNELQVTLDALLAGMMAAGECDLPGIRETELRKLGSFDCDAFAATLYVENPTYSEGRFHAAIFTFGSTGGSRDDWRWVPFCTMEGFPHEGVRHLYFPDDGYIYYPEPAAFEALAKFIASREKD